MSNSALLSGANPVFQDSELVLGLVAPVGTNFERFLHALGRLLKDFSYEMNPVRLSDVAQRFRVSDLKEVEGTPEFVRLNRRMNEGDALRSLSGRADFLALAAAQSIHDRRNSEPVQRRVAHVIRSLKHPDEVATLRRIYGSGFYLIAITADAETRRDHLCNDRGCTPEEADLLLNRDEHEEDPKYIGPDGTNYGQQMRSTFHLADVFVPLDGERQLGRFFHLVFGCPFQTPDRDEYPMFLAFASALRSGDLSRQVGAVVVSTAGDVVAVGANDVPAPGGGLYWPGLGDQRDHVVGHDSNERQRTRILDEVLEALRPEGRSADEWSKEGRGRLAGTQLMDITEYGRAAHAEMEALLSCGRSGISTRGTTLYSTTFPCHNCAKHIVAAGVTRVVYVEPYPKSQAMELFKDSIRAVDAGTPAPTDDDGRVAFQPFEGIGPVVSSTFSRWDWAPDGA